MSSAFRPSTTTRGKGTRVALDDVTRVGGGNLPILARCNIHIVKLDQSLIDQITPRHSRPPTGFPASPL